MVRCRGDERADFLGDAIEANVRRDQLAGGGEELRGSAVELVMITAGERRQRVLTATSASQETREAHKRCKVETSETRRPEAKRSPAQRDRRQREDPFGCQRGQGVGRYAELVGFTRASQTQSYIVSSSTTRRRFWPGPPPPPATA
jgi:hypothetical protein